MALTQARTTSQAKTLVSGKKKKDKKQRSIVITQLRAEETANKVRNMVSGLYTIEITRNNRYNISDCPNKGYTYITYGNHAYIRLNSYILKQWDKAVAKGRATVMELPRHLIGKLLEGIVSRQTAKQAR